MDQLQGFGDAIEQVMKEIREKLQHASRQAGAIESLKAFAAAVDWSEPWILAVIAFHTVLLIAAVVLRNNLYVSGVILAAAASIIYGGERLNQLLSKHWKQFARQPYFDQNGIFFGAVFSAPLLLTMFIILGIRQGRLRISQDAAVVVNYLISSSSLLIKLKRKELIHKARQRREQANQGNLPDNRKKDK